jgi:hypothetical protein
MIMITMFDVDARCIASYCTHSLCQDYLTKHSGTQYKQAQTRHSRQKLRQDGERVVIREMEEANSFSTR